MQRHENMFTVLAVRVEEGDTGAQSELRRQLEPELVRIVRRVIRHGVGRTPVDRRILAEARRLGLDAASAQTAAGECLIRSVASSVGALLIAGLRPRAVDPHAIGDTICN